jgi:hypothetical protein
MALHEALIALQTGCSGLLTLKQDDPYFKKVENYFDLFKFKFIFILASSNNSICSSRRIRNT